jgi:chitinase
LTSYTSTISSFQSSGGTAILSFGGYGSSELSFSQTNETKLQAAYEQFYTTYGVKIWDFDIEGSMATDVASQNRRNRVLSSLQAKYSDLEIYFTVSISETGLDSTGLALVNRTKNAGVKMSLVNVMLFDYYTSSANNNVNDSKTALTALRTQLDRIDKNLKIGATLMIGKDDSGKVLTVANTTTLLDWISVNIPSATHIAYWAMHRDTPGSNINTSAGITGFTAGDYLKTFKSYA